jgi:hypothetical protein
MKSSGLKMHRHYSVMAAGVRSECDTIIMGILEGLLLKRFYFLSIIYATNVIQKLKLIR